MTIRAASQSDFSWVNSCYAEIDFVASKPGDFVAIAELGMKRIGLGRLVPVEGMIGELGGMYVLPEYRRGNVARSIVQFLLDSSRFAVLYCIPFSRLSAFYEAFGFRPVSNGASIPAEVGKKFSWCKQHYHESVNLLVRQA